MYSSTGGDDTLKKGSCSCEGPVCAPVTLGTGEILYKLYHGKRELVVAETTSTNFHTYNKFAEVVIIVPFNSVPGQADANTRV